LALEDRYTVLSIAPLLASAIAHVNQHKSVSALI
jgi:phosphoribosylpyrophosphate synthetase